MKRVIRSAALLALVAGCAGVTEGEPSGSQSEAVFVPILPDNGDNSVASDPAYDTASGFAFLSTATKIPLSQFDALVTDALVTRPGYLASVAQKMDNRGGPTTTVKADAQTFLADVSANVAGNTARTKARLVEVYSDAPVYVVNSPSTTVGGVTRAGGAFALLPDVDNRPVPANVLSDPAAFNAFCVDNVTRCIALSHDHAENRDVAAILLAARTVIVKHAANTDGMSLMIVTENLLFPDGDSALDLSVYGYAPNGANVDVNTRYAPNPVDDYYRSMPNSPPVREADINVTTNPDVLQQRGGRSLHDGLNGRSAGNLFVMAYRATKMRVMSYGQSGGNGGSGASLAPGCAPFTASANPACNSCVGQNVGNQYGGVCYTLASPGSPDPTSSYCQSACAYPKTKPDDAAGQQDLPDFRKAGNGGTVGSWGSIGIDYVEGISNIGCSTYTEASLRDDNPARATIRGDAVESANVACTNGLADDGTTGAVDCAAPGCSGNVDVTACGTGGRFTAPPSIPIYNFSSTRSSGAAPAAEPKQVLSAMPVSLGGGGVSGSLFGGFGGIGKLCITDWAVPSLSVMGGRLGQPGTPGGTGTLFCATNADNVEAFCGVPSTINMAGTYASYPSRYNGDGHSSPTSGVNLAIAVHGLHPLEIRRRLAVAHQRFQQGEIASAITRYLDTRYLLEANQLTLGLTGHAFDCAAAAATLIKTPKSGDDPSKEICGLRLELDSYLSRAQLGLNYFGYTASWEPPRMITFDQTVAWANAELASAQANVNTFHLGSRLQNIQTLVQDGFSTQLSLQLQDLQTQLSPTGELSVAQSGVMQDIAADQSLIASLALQSQQLGLQSAQLKFKDAQAAMSGTDLEAWLISTAITVGTAAIAPEAAPIVAVALKDATGGLSNQVDVDLTSNVASYDDHDAPPTPGALGTDAQNGVTDWGKSAADGANPQIPAQHAQALAGSSDAAASSELQQLGLTMQQAGLAIALRDAAQTLARDVVTLHQANAKIADAQAQVLRLQSAQAEFTQHAWNDAQLNALLKATYDAALMDVRNAGEYAFLVKRAAMRDGVPYALASTNDGTKQDTLTLALDQQKLQCGAATSDSVYANFTNLDCYRQRVTAIQTWLKARAAQFTLSGATQIVVPITASMLSNVSGTPTYQVPVDVSVALANGLPLHGGSRIHQLTDAAVFVDTGSGVVGGSAYATLTHDPGDLFWVGPRTAGEASPGTDPTENVMLTTALAGPVTASSTTGPLSVLFQIPGWNPTPPLTFQVCRGDAATNQNRIATVTSAALPCSLAGTLAGLTDAQREASPFGQYVGRALLGRYTVAVPQSELVGGVGALRLYLAWRAIPQ